MGGAAPLSSQKKLSRCTWACPVRHQLFQNAGSHRRWSGAVGRSSVDPKAIPESDMGVCSAGCCRTPGDTDDRVDELPTKHSVPVKERQYKERASTSSKFLSFYPLLEHQELKISLAYLMALFGAPGSKSITQDTSWLSPPVGCWPFTHGCVFRNREKRYAWPWCCDLFLGWCIKPTTTSLLFLFFVTL
jgi:hypothetical protein